MRWESSGIVYEPDQRHVEMVFRELGLESAGSVFTLGTHVEHEAASAPSGVLGLALEDDSKDLEPQDATRFRGSRPGSGRYSVCLQRGKPPNGEAEAR